MLMEIYANDGLKAQFFLSLINERVFCTCGYCINYLSCNNYDLF